MRKLTLKKIVSFALTASIVLSCIGCGRPEPPSNEMIDAHKDDENYITCLVWDREDLPDGADYDNNKLANWIRENVMEECGVEVHFISVPRNSSDEELTRMIDIGVAPDIIFTYSSALYGYLTRQGKVADLTDAYILYGSNIKDNIGDIQYMGKYKSRQAAIMKRRGFTVPRHVAYIRKDWCEALGMDVPSTKQELIDFLYAVKEKNPGNVNGLVPWAMGGDLFSEKAYQSFVTSYIDELTDRDAYIYSEKYLVLTDDAREGLKKLNELYNDGIISGDFAADKNDEAYEKAVREGKTAFVVEDATAPFGYIDDIKKADSSAEFDPVLCFDLPSGGYRNVTEPLYGMYVMVPESSKNKAESVMKYLNWLADPENAIKIQYTPDYDKTDNGAPITLTQGEYNAKGYPGTPGDYCIINSHFDYMEEEEAQVDTWAEGCTWEDREWFENLYEICMTDQYIFPSTGEISSAETSNKDDLEKRIIEYAFNVISCPKEEFEEVASREHDILMESGISDILDERAAFFDEGKVITEE